MPGPSAPTPPLSRPHSTIQIRGAPRCPDHRGHGLAARRDDRPDQGLRRRRLPRRQPVPGAGPRRHGRRAQDRRVLPGPASRPGPQAVAVSPGRRYPHPEEPRDVRRRRPGRGPGPHRADRRGHPRRARRGDRRLPRGPRRPSGPTRSTAPSGPSSAPLLEAGGTPGQSLPALVSRTLRRAAEGRLAAEGWDDRRVRLLLDQEPGSPDDWLAYLILSSRAQIGPLLGPDGPDRA